jgi:2'-phosphotransferase
MGISMDAGGRVLVSDLLRLPDFAVVTVEDIILVVESCDKQRFSLSKQEGCGELMIRANQGHTLTGLDTDEYLEKLSTERVLEITNGTGLVYHGTYENVLPKIQSEGLCRMSRNHVHFAQTYDGPVLSGIRRSCEVVVVVDVIKAMEEGLVFYRSANGVILCSGSGERGIITPKFLSKVIRLR